MVTVMMVLSSLDGRVLNYCAHKTSEVSIPFHGSFASLDTLLICSGGLSSSSSSSLISLHASLSCISAVKARRLVGAESGIEALLGVLIRERRLGGGLR